MIYLACPYTSPHPEVMQKRYDTALEYLATFMKENPGIFIYSPIVHCHYAAVHHDMPRDADFWWAFNRAALNKSDYLHVLMMEGFDTSRGVAQEVAYWEETKPNEVLYVLMAESIVDGPEL